MSGLISTWLNDLPLYTPTTEPIISGRMIMLRKCVRTVSGRSPPASFFACMVHYLHVIAAFMAAAVTVNKIGTRLLLLLYCSLPFATF